MINKTFKTIVKSMRYINRRIIEPTGYRISKVDKGSSNGRKQIFDLRSITTDPIDAVYRAGSSQTSAQNSWVIINVPMSLLRSCPMGFGDKSQYPDPFVETVNDYRNGVCVTYKGSILEKYYRFWQPKNAAELLGLSEYEASEALLRTPPPGTVWPWDFDHPERRAQQNHVGDEGWQHCGPVTQDKGRMEFSRYQKVADSIIKNGYQRNPDTIDGDIAAQVLVRGREWKFLICDGMHRFAVLKALGFSTIPVCLRRWPMLIRREDVLSWPNVTNLLFNADSATKIFDRLFDAALPVNYPDFREEIYGY
jgi:hypothetical protein